MKKFFSCLIIFPALVFAQQDSVLSGKYSWQTTMQGAHRNTHSAILFQGKTMDMEYLQMSANDLLPSREKMDQTVAQNEEQLLLIKEGEMVLGIGDSTWHIGSGSVALLLPSEKYTMQNLGSNACSYYLLKYRSKAPVDLTRGKAVGGSTVKDWNKIEFKPHDRGGIRNYFERPTAMAKRLEMHVTTLKEGIKSHEPHTHRAEEIVLMVRNKTEMQIGQQFYKGSDGDIYYLGSNIPHAIRNTGIGHCIYFAIQFE